LWGRQGHGWHKWYKGDKGNCKMRLANPALSKELSKSSCSQRQKMLPYASRSRR